MQRCLRASHFFSAVTEASAGSDLTSERFLDYYWFFFKSSWGLSYCDNLCDSVLCAGSCCSNDQLPHTPRRRGYRHDSVGSHWCCGYPFSWAGDCRPPWGAEERWGLKGHHLSMTLWALLKCQCLPWPEKSRGCVRDTADSCWKCGLLASVVWKLHICFWEQAPE